MTTISLAQLRLLDKIATATDRYETVTIPRARSSKVRTFEALESYGYIEGQGVQFRVTERGRAVLRMERR